jgi:RHS repeat-associated protein
MAKPNPFRFSTKYQDDETDLLYYGYRYYSAGTGKWVGRDSREEGGGIGLFTFVQNSPISSVDPLGEAAIDPNNKLIVMGKCEIVILYGHGIGLKNWHWRWRYPDANCAAGTAIMCWPAINVDGLADSMNLWTVWGGERVDESNWEKVYWGMPANGADFFEGTLHFHFPNAKKVLVQVAKSAVTRAGEICKRCSCGSVKISYVEIDHQGKPVEPKRPLDDVPVVPDIIIPCGAGGTDPGGPCP